MPTRLNTACLPAQSRSRAPGARTSVSTTSTVGRRIRCLARSRRREGTVTRTPAAASEATRWRPMKPEPPTTTTLPYFMRPTLAQLFLQRRLDRARRVDDAEPRLERHRLLVEHRSVERRVRHDLLHVVARLGEWDRFDVDRAFERLLVAPAPRARRAGVVGGGGEHRVAELLH